MHSVWKNIEKSHHWSNVFEKNTYKIFLSHKKSWRKNSKRNLKNQKLTKFKMIKNYESKNENISPISLQFFGYVLADNKYVFVIHSRKSNILKRQQSME